MKKALFPIIAMAAVLLAAGTAHASLARHGQDLNTMDQERMIPMGTGPAEPQDGYGQPHDGFSPPKGISDHRAPEFVWPLDPILPNTGQSLSAKGGAPFTINQPQGLADFIDELTAPMTAVPAPPALILLGIGLMGLAGARRQNKK